MAALSEQFPPSAFQGFPPGGLAFFRGLAEHQDKSWFTAHRQDYERLVQAPLASLVTDLSARFAAADLPFRGDPKRSIFRLNRDIRFSKDKRPYKTHAGAALTPSGDKNAPGVFYVHLDPAGCFVAAGFYAPEPRTMHRLRLGLAAKPEAWLAMVRDLSRDGLDLAEDDRLARTPRGFERAASAVSEALRLKSWIVRRALPEASLADAGLLDELAAFAAAAAPLLRFGLAALDRHPAVPGVLSPGRP